MYIVRKFMYIVRNYATFVDSQVIDKLLLLYTTGYTYIILCFVIMTCTLYTSP